MRVFIVHAHHEPRSFNSAMTREAAAALLETDHEVIVSDLHAMGFDPVSDRRNFTQTANRERLKQQDEEAHASRTNTYAPELQAEMDKLEWCDALIFQFPIWWLGLPGILKGWVDRVFAVGRAYGGGRWFDGGVFAGKRAMLSVTMGGPREVYTEAGMYGPVEAILHPIHRGIFHFTGFTVVEPFIVYGPTRMSDDERHAHLARYRERVINLGAAPVIPMPRSDAYEGFVKRSAS